MIYRICELPLVDNLMFKHVAADLTCVGVAWTTRVARVVCVFEELAGID